MVQRAISDLRKPLPQTSVEEVLFDPLVLPVTALVSLMDPYSLGPGEWRQLGGLRRDRRTLRSRDGHARYDLGGLPLDGSFRGEWAGQLVGTNFFNVGVFRRLGTSKVHIYTTNSGTYGEITLSGGKYGDTRLSDVHSPVFVEAVTDKRNGNEYLIFQNATDEPRVWTPGGELAVHHPVEVPKGASDQKTVPTFPVYFPIAGTARPTYTNITPAKFELADTGTGPDFSLIIKVDSTFSTLADTGEVRFAAPIDFSDSRQLIFALETPVLNFFDNLKIELGDGSSYYTAWNPDDATKIRTRSIELDVNTNREIIGFNIDAIASDCGAIDRIRLTWVGASPPVDLTAIIHMIAGSGKVRGRARHKISYNNQGSRAESYGVLIPNVEPARIKDIGGPDLNGARLPNVRDLFYRFDVVYLNTSQAERNAGVDHLVVYRSDEGDADYSLVGDIQIASYSGVWSFSAGGEFEAQVYQDDLASDGKVLSIVAPSAEHVSMPIATAMISTNNRLFLGAKLLNGFCPGVWFSSKDYPFRFEAIGAPGDPNAGSSFLLTGENITGFASIATSTIGASTIYIFTEKRVYEVNGLSTQNLLRWTIVSATGCKSPLSISEHSGSVFFVDDRLQLRRIGVTVDNLSRLTVDDKFQAIPASRRAWITSTFIGERLYVAYTPTGGSTNTRCLVFNEILEQIEADDSVPAPFTVEGFSLFYDNAQKRQRLLAYSSDQRVYEYEQPGSPLDFGTSKIPVELVSREIHYPYEQTFTIERVGVHCDGDTGSTLNLDMAYSRTGSVLTHQIGLTLASGKTRIFAWTRQVSNNGIPSGPSCILMFTGSLTGGKNIYGIVYEVAPKTGGGRDG